jgi:ATP-dependent RNA helicase RhlE
MSFEQLHIHPRLTEQLLSQRITEPTPIQVKAIPPALEGRDVVAIAQTGTGKTLAFGLPAITRLAKNKNPGTRMLVLTPTRELAHQISSVLTPLGEPHGLKVACIYGGVGFEPQTQALRKGVPIIIATPGRLLDHIRRGNARFDNVSILVLDEADRMLDMGFMPDMKSIIGKLPKDRQTMMFSATFPQEIARLAGDFQRDAVRVEVGTVLKPVDAVTQTVYTVQPDQKMELLAKVLGGPGVDTALVFIRTKHRTDRVAKILKRDGFKAQAIHGGRSQSQRQQALDGFRNGKFNVLVATDVAARGLDIYGITHVVNFDIPKTTEDYVHRIGRTARAKATGDAITFVCPEDAKGLRDIERELGKSIPQAEWEGAVALPAGRSQASSSAKPRHGQHPPRRQGGGQQRQGRGHSPAPSRSHEQRGPARHKDEKAAVQHPRREHAPAERAHSGEKPHDDKLRAPAVSKNHTTRREPRSLGQFSRPKLKRPA